MLHLLLVYRKRMVHIGLYQLQNHLSCSIHDSTFCATTSRVLLSIHLLKLVGNLCYVFEKGAAVDLKC